MRVHEEEVMVQADQESIAVVQQSRLGHYGAIYHDTVAFGVLIVRDQCRPPILLGVVQDTLAPVD